MIHLYIDESGSMTRTNAANQPYFVVAVVRIYDVNKAKRLHKRFVQTHMNALQKIDRDGKMFRDGKFIELKGAALTPELKRKFVEYFCRPETLEVYFIQINNDSVRESLYRNTARAFNYVLNLALKYYFRQGYLPDEKCIIQLDERNEKTETKYFLSNYLNTVFRIEEIVSEEMTVAYFDSAQNRLIQIADVLANFYYSELRTGNYADLIQQMKESGCMKPVFRFPLR